jgi:pimeloyl-ACP methyl ester carboxylesterase
MKITGFLILLCSALQSATGQEAVFFTAEDGLNVRGDLYLKNNQMPFIILCHQDGANRSEYFEVAPRLLNLNYNCLAIDLRTGGKSGFTQNETAIRASSENRDVKPLDATADIMAAIRYAKKLNNKPVVLLGSFSSASLCFITAAGNPDVMAIIALSPGEYFQPWKTLAREVEKNTQMVFVSATQTDYAYLQQLMSALPSHRLTLFKPEKSKGFRGTAALTSAGESNSEYWFALMMFFKKLG